MKLCVLAFSVAISACQQDRPVPAASSETAVAPEAFAGRILENRQTKYGELLAARTRSGDVIQTAIIYRVGGVTDPATGQPVAFIASGLDVECDTERMRYTSHQGRSDNGESLYQVALPEDVSWNSGDRVAPLIKSLCAEPTAGEPSFDGASDFFSRTAVGPTPVPAVVSIDR